MDVLPPGPTPTTVHAKAIIWAGTGLESFDMIDYAIAFNGREIMGLLDASRPLPHGLFELFLRDLLF